MSGLVPRVTTLEEVYFPAEDGKVSPEHTQRFTNLIHRFKSTYGQAPDGVARSPGRVNIIGEHIDYSLYSVLPTAITVDALIAFRAADAGETSSTADAVIKIANVNPDKYPSKEFRIPVSGEVEIDAKNHEWSNYFKAGLKGALGFLRDRQASSSSSSSYAPNSMEVLIDGNVPAGGGLSSSAAFVCASALAVMEANGHKVSKQDLLDLCIVSERSVGVFSGGMDQAASIFSERGYLLYCQFFPEFKAEHVPVPKSDPEITFLVAQSFITSDKAVTAPKHYNLRVVECTLATVVLAKAHEIVLNPDKSSLGFCLRNFEEEYMRREGKLDDSPTQRLETLISVIESSLTKESYTREDIASTLEISVDTLTDTYMSKFPVQASTFKLRQRATHVAHEALRVLQFKNILSQNANTLLKTSQLEELGSLMNATQTSCRDIYECSSPEIDEMCAIARRNGALGSRLTGAGWGGCTVHLVPQDKIHAVTEALKTEYYIGHLRKSREEVDDDDSDGSFVKKAFVVSKPGVGSLVIEGAALDV